MRLNIAIEIAISIFSSQNENNAISLDELKIRVVDLFVAAIIL